MAMLEKGIGLSDDVMRYIMGLMNAAKNTPRNAPRDVPAMFAPRTPTNPLNTTVRNPVTGRMESTMGFSPGQVAGSRAAIAAPIAAVGYNASRPDAPGAPDVGTREDYGPSDAQLRAEGIGTREDYGKSDAEYRAEENSARAANSPARPTAAFAPAAPAAPAASLMGRLFGGPDYQSNSQAVVSRPQGLQSDGAPQRAVLNWADSDNAADFFRADRAMQELLKNKEEFVGKNNTDFGRMASGGSVDGSSSKTSGGRDAAIYKALEIIHNLLMQRR